MPDDALDPSFGAAAVTRFSTPNTQAGYSIGDVNRSGTNDYDFSDGVDLFDVAPFIAVLASGDYQFEADCNQDQVVNFRDIFPFIRILGLSR